MNKTKFNFIILAIFITIFTGCTHQPKYSNSVLFSFITPNLRISDAGFIHHYQNQTQIQIYNSGSVILNLKLAQNICINGVCSDRQSFNTKYLKSAHYDEIIDDILYAFPFGLFFMFIAGLLLIAAVILFIIFIVNPLQVGISKFRINIFIFLFNL